MHGWVFDIHSGKLIDLNIDFESILQEIKEIYRLAKSVEYSLEKLGD